MVLSLYSDTFIWMNKSRILVYNCGKGTYYEGENNQYIASLCKSLQDGNNLYSIEIEEDDSIAKSFAQIMVANNLGVLNEKDNYISFPPVLKIQDRIVGKEGTPNPVDSRFRLRSLSLFMGGECDGSDLFCRQSDYPISSHDVMNCQTAIDTIQKYSPIADEVKIIISNVIQIDSLNDLLDSVIRLGDKAVICLRMNDDDIKPVIEYLAVSGVRVRLVGFPTDYARSVSHTNIDDRIEIEFLIGSNQDIQMVEDLPDTLKSDVSIVPVYDGTNKDFIEGHMRISKSLLLGSKMCKRHVFIHQTINSELYGHLYIYPDGSICSSPMASPIGTISSLPKDVIHRAMDPESPWFMTRCRVCGECLYKYLCPSPSILEEMVDLNCVLE